MRARRLPKDADRRALHLMVAGWVVLSLASGCKGKSEQAGVFYSQFTDEIQVQLAEVESVAAEVQKGIDATNLRLDGMDANDAQLVDALAHANARPQEVMTEILDEVDGQLEEFARQQEEGAGRMALQLDEADTTLNHTLKTRYDAMHARMDEDERFLQFFYHEQDSINQILASRFDRKPWYNSILSGWKGTGSTSQP